VAAVRPAAVAGMFYTGNAAALRREVQGFLGGARPAHHRPKAIIAPHAGYMYSGAIAGSAYASVRQIAGEINRVVLLGPAHRVYVEGVAVPTVDAFATPIGSVPLDQEALADLVNQFPFVQYRDDAHTDEHSLEVQLPFLQTLLGDFSLLPFAVGNAHPAQIEQLLEQVWGGRETLIVISSDLSHYHSYTDARALDSYTTEHISALDPAGLTGEHACGHIPVRGLLRCATRHGLKCEVLDVRNSGDTAGGRAQVVGYGAYLFYEAGSEQHYSDDERARLTALARDSIAHGLSQGEPLPVDLDQWPESLRKQRATFVTLNHGAQLRGCIGSLEATQPLVQDIADNAFAAAFRDPRFSPVTERDLAELDVHISVLSPPEPVQFTSEKDLLAQIRPGVDGLILIEGRQRGTFLPSVWQNLPERNAFLAQLKRKAGLPANYWSPTVQVSRYTTESW